MARKRSCQKPFAIQFFTLTMFSALILCLFKLLVEINLKPSDIDLIIDVKSPNSHAISSFSCRDPININMSILVHFVPFKWAMIQFVANINQLRSC